MAASSSSMMGRSKGSLLGPVALGYLVLEFAANQLKWLPSSSADGVRAAVWVFLGLAALSRVPVYGGWSAEARCVPVFLLSVVFMVASLSFEATFGVHFVTVVMGLDWHRAQAPLPDAGQWLFLSLDQRLPAAVTAVLRAPLLGLHHFLMLFLMLAFSALFNCTARPGLHIGAQYMRAMAWGRLLRVACFVGTILPSPRPWCAPHRFVAPDPASPWAAQFHLPYAHDQMALWALLNDHRPAAPAPAPAPEYVPDWGPLQFLAPFLRPTAAASPGFAAWFSTLTRAGGGCNDLVFSGHMLVATLTAMAFQELHPGWTSRIIWGLLAHSGMREIRERHHYSADVVLGTFVGVMLWKATSPAPAASGERENELRKAAKDGDMERIRDILDRNRPLSLREMQNTDWRTTVFGFGLVAGTFLLCLTVFYLSSNG